MRYEFLLPYSPDFNPIELAFSAFKYHLKWDGEYLRMAMAQKEGDKDVYMKLYKAIFDVGSPQNAFARFRKCRYV
jgi:transposase